MAVRSNKISPSPTRSVTEYDKPVPPGDESTGMTDAVYAAVRDLWTNGAEASAGIDVAIDAYD